MSMRFRFIQSALFAAGVLAAGATALAQDAEGFELSEVVVTATKVETNLQDTPMTITALSGESIQDSGKSNLTQILQDVPGLQANTAGNFGQYYWVRGIGSSPTFGQDSAVTVSINGVFQQMAQAGRGGQFDIDRVEVARGPQSTLTGRNSLGGAINVITAKPVKEFHAEGQFGVGSLNLMTTQGMLNAPIGNSMALRAAFSTEKRDGLLSNGASDSDLLAGRVRFLIEPNEDFNLIFSAERSKTTGKGVGSADSGLLVPANESGLTQGRYCRNVTECAAAITNLTALPGAGFNNLPLVTDPYTSFSPSAPYSRAYDAKSFYVDLNWNLGWGKLFVQPTWIKSEAKDYNQTFSMLQYATWAERVVRLAPTMPVAQQEQVARALATGLNWTHLMQEQKTLEVRFSSPDDSRVKWLGGLYFFENSENARVSVTAMGVVGTYSPGVPESYCLPSCIADTPMAAGTIPLTAVGVSRTIDNDPTLSDVLSVFRPGVDPSRVNRDIAAFAQIVYPVTENANLTVGARYTKEKKTRDAEDPNVLPRTYFVNNNAAGTGAIVNRYAIEAQSFTWNLFDYRATLDYKFSPENMVYLSISTGFRGGNFQNVGTATHTRNGAGAFTALATPVAPLAGFGSIYDPERLTSYEIGTRNDLLNNRMRLNASAYFYDYRDYQYSYNAVVWADQDPDAPLAYTANVGKAKVYGVDFEGSFLLTPRDQLSLSAAYINSELGQLTLPGGTAAAVADANSLKGQPLRRSAEWSGGPRYSHRFDLGEHGTLTASLDSRYESESYVNNVAAASLINTNRFIRQPSYTRSNFTLSYQTQDGRFSVNAYARNLEDEITLGTVGANVTAAGNTQLQNFTWDPSEGRSYGVTFGVRL